MKPKHQFAVALLLALLSLGLLMSCDGESDRERDLKGRLEDRQARLDEVRDRLIEEQERGKEQMAHAHEELQAQRQQTAKDIDRIRRDLSEERQRTEAVESDFLVAAVVSLSAVLAVFLLLHLLLRELASRKALARFLRWVGGRNGDGNARS